MSRFGQQWKGFNAWASTLDEPERGRSSTIEARAAVPVERLGRHPRPRIGLVCPRCGGEVVPFHPAERDPTCLQCGFEPVERQPAAYVFEPYEDRAANSRYSYVRDDVRNGAITVRVAKQPLSPFVCVGCGAVPGADEPPLKVHRCSDCYREYCAQLRFGVA